MSCIDHVGLVVADYARAKAFYDNALAPLGIAAVMEIEHGGRFAGFGTDRPFFWIGDQGRPTAGTHGTRGKLSGTGRRLLRRGAGCRWHRQRRAWSAPALSPELLRRLRPRS